MAGENTSARRDVTGLGNLLGCGPRWARRSGGAMMIVGVAAVGVLAGAAHGGPGVRFYDVFKSGFANQIDETTQPSVFEYRAFLRVIYDAEAVSGDATCLVPGAPNATVLDVSGVVAISVSGAYTFASAVDVDYPVGSYDFELTTGPLAPATASISVPESVYPAATPMFIDGTFDTLFSVNPNEDFNGTVSTFEPPPGATESRTFVRVGRLSGEELYIQEMFPGDSAFTIPAGTMDTAVAGSYQITVYHSVRYGPFSGFGPMSKGVAAFDLATSAPLMTVITASSCSPADIANTDGDTALTGGGPDGAIDNGDFTAFFSAFFLEPSDPLTAAADIANTDSDTTLTGGGPDGAVDNGDFTAFFAYFFLGCPLP